MDKREQFRQFIKQQASEIKTAPLSNAQKRIYFTQKLKPESTVYNIFRAFHINGNFNVQTFKKALNIIVFRHGSLRSNFYHKDGKDIQVVNPFMGINIPVLDISDLPADQKATEIDRLLIDEASFRFNLASDSLIQVKLCKTYDNEYILSICMHHIITDGWSMRILYNELSTIYNNLINNREHKLAELPIQYTDFVFRQKTMSESEKLRTQLQYWKDKLEDYPPVHQIPLDYKRPAEQLFKSGRVDFSIDNILFSSLKNISKETKTTLYMVLLSAYSVLISKYSNHSDIIIGTPIANRNDKDIESLIGFFVNTLALRINVLHNLTFKELLQLTKETIIEASENQDISFEQIVEELQPERTLNYNPIIQLVFAYHNLPRLLLTFEDVKTEQILTNTDNIAYDIEVHLNNYNSGDYIEGYFLYNSSIFDEEKIEGLSKHFINILKNISIDSGQKISELEFLSDTEKNHILTELTSYSLDYPKDKNICELFEIQSSRYPDRIAIVCNNKNITYKELNEKANQLARYLHNNFMINQEEPIAVILERNEWVLVSIMGIIKSGASYLPVDPMYPSSRKKYMLQDSNVKIIICQSAHKAALEEDFDIVDISNSSIYEEEKNDLKLTISPDNLIYIIYTSGTTGEPKGVMVEHKTVSNLCYWHNHQFEVTESDIATQYASFSFDASIWEIFPYFLKGAAIHIIPESIKLDVNKLHQYYNKNHVSISFLPTQICENFIRKDNKSLRVLLTGGDKLKRFIPNSFKLYNNYGPTENTVVSTFYMVEKEFSNIPIGKPVANNQLYIMAKGSYTLLPVNVFGEICVGGDSLARGYINEKDTDKGKFVLNKNDRNKRIYRTGDIGRLLPDGNVEISGRVDNQVKIRGHRIELEDVESNLLSHEYIKEAIVITAEDKKNFKCLCAYYTSEKNIGSNELKEFLLNKLPGYMVPSYFIKLEEIPLTVNGKVDKKALPEISNTAADSTIQNEKPQDNNEKIILEIWKEILNIENIGVNDNFFDVGGHSLLIAELIDSMKKKANIDMEIIDMFRYSTIRAINNNFNKRRNNTKNEIVKDEETNIISRQKNLESILKIRKK